MNFKKENVATVNSQRKNINALNDHELIFLGTGGGRIHCVTQYRKTGGIIYKFSVPYEYYSKENENQSKIIQAHIDPGPGAIVYLNKMKIDRLKTKYIIVTHGHTDHMNDVPVIIESVHETLKKRKGTLIAPNSYLKDLPNYYKDLLLKIMPFKSHKAIQIEPNIIIQGTEIKHGNTEGFGIIFNHFKEKIENLEELNFTNNATTMEKMEIQNKILYKIAFTSDTEIFNGYIKQYKGVDILIANVLRPDSKYCPRHATIDEIIPAIKEIKPKAVILTHFGAFMDSIWSKQNLVPQQVEKVQQAVGNSIKIIGAEDGQKISIKDLL
ncbi:MAG: MBL fold metallo-hydrolase [Promethearchaeota archaeon]